VLQHAVDGLKVFLAFIVQALRLALQILESAFGIDVNSVFGIVADI